MLDMGRRLGRFITRYRSAYFQPDKRQRPGGVLLQAPAGAEDAIYERISDITISMRAGDYLDMPECVGQRGQGRTSPKGAAILRHHEGGAGALPER